VKLEDKGISLRYGIAMTLEEEKQIINGIVTCALFDSVNIKDFPIFYKTYIGLWPFEENPPLAISEKAIIRINTN
jgi:hypothetical protein